MLFVTPGCQVHSSQFTIGCHASIIIGNTNFGNIDNLVSQGRYMEYIARHYNMDLPHLQNVQFSSLSNLEPLNREPLNLSYCYVK